MVSSVANGKTKVWDTDWVTLFGASGATYVRFYAPQAEYLDAGSYTNLTLRVSMPGVTNIGLVLQHSNTLEGYFRNVYGDEEQQLYGTTTMMLILSSEGGDRQFSRYLRWGLSLEDETGAPQWRACFRIEAFV